MIPACVLAGVALLCLEVWGLMEYFGSPLIPGSLERRYAREVAAHRQELLDFFQQCLETGAVPEGASLPGFVRDVQVSGQKAESLFVEFGCDGWGLVLIMVFTTTMPIFNGMGGRVTALFFTFPLVDWQKSGPSDRCIWSRCKIHVRVAILELAGLVSGRKYPGIGQQLVRGIKPWKIAHLC